MAGTDFANPWPPSFPAQFGDGACPQYPGCTAADKGLVWATSPLRGTTATQHCREPSAPCACPSSIRNWHGNSCPHLHERAICRIADFKRSGRPAPDPGHRASCRLRFRFRFRFRLSHRRRPSAHPPPPPPPPTTGARTPPCCSPTACVSTAPEGCVQWLATTRAPPQWLNGSLRPRSAVRSRAGAP